MHSRKCKMRELKELPFGVIREKDGHQLQGSLEVTFIFRAGKTPQHTPTTEQLASWVTLPMGPL
jgi:hypothetical protein